MSDVTISGPGGSTIAISITNTTADNIALTQSFLSVVSDEISAGLASGQLQLAEVTTPGAINIAAGTGSSSGAIVNSSTGGGLYELIVPSNFAFLVASGVGVTVALEDVADPTVSAIGGADLVFVNNSFADVLVGGGYGYIAQGSSTAKAVINIQGSDTFGVGGAIVDASKGATTVNLYENSANIIETGGQVLINAQVGTEILELTGATTVPATITGTAGSTLWLLNQSNAFINPGAGDVVILPGSTGSATLFGGALSNGGTGIAAPLFTGSATVFGGTGYYQGGSAGNNVLITSTVAGATTLVGGSTVPGATDILESFGASDQLIAGPGSALLIAEASFDTLLGGQGTNLLYSYSSSNDLIGGSGSATLIAFTSGDTLTAGSGADVLIGQSTLGGNSFVSGSGSDTILGNVTGNNTIGFGSGNTLAFGQHGLSSIGPYTSNVYYQAAGGTAAVDNISDFLPGSDVFSLSLSADSARLASINYYSTAASSPFGKVGTQAILSDGTTINFLNANVTKSSFT